MAITCVDTTDMEDANPGLVSSNNAGVGAPESLRLSDAPAFDDGRPHEEAVYDDECGKVRVNLPPADSPEAAPRITGGGATRAGEHPWQATIRVRGKERSYHWCGAVIVTRYHLLTAAHCLKEFPKSSYMVRVGDFAQGKICNHAD